MKPGTTRPATTPKSKVNERVARWISFVALAALLAMATLPGQTLHRDVAANTTHWSDTWHG
jgi:hypothetical protein